MVKKNLQRNGINLQEEDEASAQDRHSWRQRVALCIGDAGLIKAKDIMLHRQFDYTPEFHPFTSSPC